MTLSRVIMFIAGGTALGIVAGRYYPNGSLDALNITGLLFGVGVLVLPIVLPPAWRWVQIKCLPPYMPGQRRPWQWGKQSLRTEGKVDDQK